MSKIKENIKKFFNDKYGMLITISWIVLIVCFIIKMLGGNWFELWYDNEKFISFCNYVDKNILLKRVLACIICVATSFPIYCIMLKQQKPKWHISIILIFLTIFKSFIGYYNSIVSFMLDIFILLILITIINKQPLRNIICFLIINAMQILTILIRNLHFGFGNFTFGNTFIEQSIYQVDYYLMIELFYLYTFKNKKKKE